MNANDWVSAPVGIDSSRWVTRVNHRVVLAAAHTMVSCHRLLDVVDLFEHDSRIQVIFTVAPDVFNNGVGRHLDQTGALRIPWEQAIRERFDLCLSAAYGSWHEIHSPTMIMAHGAGRGRIFHHGIGQLAAEPTVYGLDPQRLCRDGRLLPSSLLLSHDRELDILQRQCPPALRVASVVGDLCFDRLEAGLPRRHAHRMSVGLSDRESLVVVTSTWGRRGLFGRWPDLLPDLVRELGRSDVRTGALLHPAIWAAHGRRQVRAWLKSSLDSGLILPEPADDWRQLVTAADYVVGDHGSVTAYAASVGRPVLSPSARSDAGGSVVGVPASAQEVTLRRADRLDLSHPFLPQLRAATPLAPGPVIAALTSRPGRAAHHIRAEIYRLLDLEAPDRGNDRVDARPSAPLPLISARR